MSKQNSDAPGMLRFVETGWQDTILICKKCSAKLDGGYGPEQKDSLRQAARSALRNAGRRGRVGLLDAKCFGVCPKKAVTVSIASRPGDFVVVPQGSSVSLLLDLLDGRPAASRVAHPLDNPAAAAGAAE